MVSRERAGMELDEYLCLLFPEWNKGFVRRQIRAGQVLVDGEPTHPSRRLKSDQVLILDIDPDEVPKPPVAPAVELEILEENEHWLVVAKPAGLAVEPERWARDEASLSGALLRVAVERADESDREAEGVEHRLRLAHRIDKETSGALLVAKDLETERALRTAFEEGRVEKQYLALVEGEYPLADGESEIIDAPIGPDARRSGRMVIVRGGDEDRPRKKKGAASGKPSRTRVAVERRFRGYTLLACSPLTGRTHQIRVHLAHVGFPLAVDKLYGRRDELLLSQLKPGYRLKPGKTERPLIDRLTLHAHRLGVPDLDGGAGTTEVVAPVPKDLTRALKQLERHRSL